MVDPKRFADSKEYISVKEWAATHAVSERTVRNYFP